jgi:hypothetical protein
VSSSGSGEDSLSLFFTRGSGPDTNGKQSVSLQTCHSLPRVRTGLNMLLLRR